MAKHLHLDLVGGLSGDIFIGAMLDVIPELGSGLQAVIDQAGFPELVSLEQSPHNDGVLTGTRFKVSAGAEAHHHRHYAEIRDRLHQSALPEATKAAAAEIFRLIAVVEAEIHGKSVEDVAFHEVGAWDSIADIVLAAHLIVASSASSFSVSAIPAGRGTVETAHGRLPVPVPATARLLEGFELIDDGIEGERVTPTGAAILKYLEPGQRLPSGLKLVESGYGFGTKEFPGISNVARALLYETADQQQEHPWSEDHVIRLSFDVDDQTPESLADAVSQLLALPAVLDVGQQPLFGKKGRQAVTVNVLVKDGEADSVISRCFELTTTLGIRKERIARAILKREEVVVYVNERPWRVKVAHRPGGATAKLEMEDLIEAGLSPEEQRDIRDQAEALALEQVQ